MGENSPNLVTLSSMDINGPTPPLFELQFEIHC
jgi:hypothetical protein